MKILAVDYDGVISDSVLKSLFISHNAYCKYFGSKVKKNFGGELFTFENWEEMQKQYKKEMDYYHRLRSYIELSGDFFALLKLWKSRFRLRTNRNSLLIVTNFNSIIIFFENYFLKKKRNGRKRVL